MTTIKALVNQEIAKHQNKIRPAFDIGILNIYNLLVEREIIDHKIKITNTVYPYEGNHPAIEIMDINYEELQKTYTSLDNLNGYNINDIFKLISKTDNCSLLNHPFVHLKYYKNHLCIYKNDMDILINGYNNLQLNINFDKDFRIKICKYQDSNYFHFFIFLDSLTYNDDFEFIYNDNNIYEYFKEENDNNILKLLENNNKQQLNNRENVINTIIEHIDLYFIINVVSFVVAFVILYKK
jgi:hypothetical protein